MAENYIKKFFDAPAKTKLMLMIIAGFCFMAFYNHIIKQDTSEIDAITKAFTKEYRQEAVVYLDSHKLTYKFVGKQADAGDKHFYEITIEENGKKVIVKLPTNHTIIKQYEEIK